MNSEIEQLEQEAAQHDKLFGRASLAAVVVVFVGAFAENAVPALWPPCLAAGMLAVGLSIYSYLCRDTRWNRIKALQSANTTGEQVPDRMSDRFLFFITLLLTVGVACPFSAFKVSDPVWKVALFATTALCFVVVFGLLLWDAKKEAAAKRDQTG